MTLASPLEVLAFTGLLGADSASAQEPADAIRSVAERLLEAHNGEPAVVGAPPLERDSKLAVDAASCGPVLASLVTWSISVPRKKIVLPSKDLLG